MTTVPTGPTLRYAWYGKVSTEDEQDPTLSFPRQLQNAERQVAKAGGRIVAPYYDIESSTHSYDARGSGGLTGFVIPIPRMAASASSSPRRPAVPGPSTGSSWSRSLACRAARTRLPVRWRIGRKRQLRTQACAED